METKAGVRVAKEWANSKVRHCGQIRSQQVSSLRTERKESGGHKSGLQLLAEAGKETVPIVVVQILAREKEIT
jgi:hypothetical protein